MGDTDAQLEMNDVHNHHQYNSADHATDKMAESLEEPDASENLKEIDSEVDDEYNADLKYSIEDIPPWYSCLVFGLQQHLTMFSSALVYPVLMVHMFCVPQEDQPAVLGQLFSATVFAESIGTFLQSTFGSRLPIIQGVAGSLYIPATIIMGMPQWQCKETTTSDSENYTYSVNDTSNLTHYYEPNEATYADRIKEIQGATLVAACFQLVLGFSGIVGLLLRYIGPLTVAPTLTLIGLNLCIIGLNSASKHWGISFMAMALVVIFSQYLRNVNVLYPWCKLRKRKCYTSSAKIFALFPVLLSIGVTWFFCFILTITNVFPADPEEPGYFARTDVHRDDVAHFPWFWFPIPFRWGLPTVSIAATVGMSAGVMASVIESVGDYHACAKMSGAPQVPAHAINRGIGVEGIACMIAGMWGSIGVTSYSANIGAIAITKVGSRRVIQWTSVLLFVFALMGKVAAIIVSLPTPIIGGIFWVLAGFILSVGVSNLQYTDMNSTRNLCIFGLAVSSGVIIPEYFQRNPGAISTGSVEGDQVLTIICKTGMLIAGVVGFLLDNTIPGSLNERGMTTWRKKHEANNTANSNRHARRKKTYDIPFCMPCIRKWKICRYLPFCPTFRTSPASKTRSDEDKTSV